MKRGLLISSSFLLGFTKIFLGKYYALGGRFALRECAHRKTTLWPNDLWGCANNQQRNSGAAPKGMVLPAEDRCNRQTW